MKKKTLTIILTVLALLLVAEVGFLAHQHFNPDADATVPTSLSTTQATTESTTQATTQATTEPATQPSTAPATEPTTVPTTEAPTEAPTQGPTEPQPETFLLSFAGDCTLGCLPKNHQIKYSFVDTIGEDYDYPFKNVAEYFKNDDFTMVNLEGVLADDGYAVEKEFNFRGPTAYTQILTGSSVDAVTLANNHTLDFGQAGYDSTKNALDDAEVTYVERNKSVIHTTESGLKIGIFGASFTLNVDSLGEHIRQMRKKGAEVIVLAIHWGTELSYRPSYDQVQLAHKAIDAGADIVFGHHPHVLQKVESYKDGVIFYSLGNFSFGGNNWPADLDTAILQQEIIRDVDGSISLGELFIIPCSISSLPVQNNFQPTPYEVDSEQFNRVLRKLDDSYASGVAVADYDSTEATTAPAVTEPAATTPAPTTPAPTTPAVTEPAPTTPAVTEPAGTQAPAETGTPDFPDWEDPQA